MNTVQFLLLIIGAQLGAILVAIAIVAAKLHNINETLKQIECSVRGSP